MAYENNLLSAHYSNTTATQRFFLRLSNSLTKTSIMNTLGKAVHSVKKAAGYVAEGAKVGFAAGICMMPLNCNREGTAPKPVFNLSSRAISEVKGGVIVRCIAKGTAISTYVALLSLNMFR